MTAARRFDDLDETVETQKPTQKATRRNELVRHTVNSERVVIPRPVVEVVTVMPPFKPDPWHLMLFTIGVASGLIWSSLILLVALVIS